MWAQIKQAQIKRTISSPAGIAESPNPALALSKSYRTFRTSHALVWLLALFAPSLAMAQAPTPIVPMIRLSTGGYAGLSLDANGYLNVDVQAGGSGGSGAGGTVAQGPAGSAAWLVSGNVADTNSAAWQGVVAITPGSSTPVTPARGLGFICTAAGNITLTLANGSTITLPIAAAPTTFQTLGFGVTGVTLGTGTAGTFWNLI